LLIEIVCVFFENCNVPISTTYFCRVLYVARVKYLRRIAIGQVTYTRIKIENAHEVRKMYALRSRPKIADKTDLRLDKVSSIHNINIDNSKKKPVQIHYQTVDIQ